MPPSSFVASLRTSLIVAAAATHLACGDLFHGTEWSSRCDADPSASGCGAASAAGGAGSGAGGSGAGGTSSGSGGATTSSSSGSSASSASSASSGSSGSSSSSASSSSGCVPVQEICNGLDDDCDGVCDDGAGCRLPIHRSYQPQTGEHFYSGDINEAQCCGYVLEFASYFHLYSTQIAGTDPFYRCQLPAIGMHFLTKDSGCEGAGVLEGNLGFIAAAPGLCGGDLPLWRMAHANGDHFYATSQAERDQALQVGYIDEGVVGYVWGP